MSDDDGVVWLRDRRCTACRELVFTDSRAEPYVCQRCSEAERLQVCHEITPPLGIGMILPGEPAS